MSASNLHPRVVRHPLQRNSAGGKRCRRRRAAAHRRTLQATCGSWAIGVMMATYALNSPMCTYLLPEPTGQSFDPLVDVLMTHP
jgi:hypothetical protein